MKTATVDKLIWTLVYGGLIAVALGWSVQRTDDALGWTILVSGAVATVIGIALVAVRARIKDTPGDMR